MYLLSCDLFSLNRLNADKYSIFTENSEKMD